MAAVGLNRSFDDQVKHETLGDPPIEGIKALIDAFTKIP